MKDETEENIYYEVDEDDLYKLDRTSFIRKNDMNVRLKTKSKMYMTKNT